MEPCKKYLDLTAERLPQVDPIPKFWLAVNPTDWHFNTTVLSVQWKLNLQKSVFIVKMLSVTGTLSFCQK